MKKVLFFSILIILIAAGCSVLYDTWPAMMPQDTADYLGDVNKPAGLRTLGTVKAAKERVVTKHIREQLDLKHLMEKDSALYARAIEEANFNINIAELDRDHTLGTIEKPGWLLGLLLGGTGFGAWFAGYKTQRPEDYNETEFQTAVAKALKENAEQLRTVHSS